MTISYRNIVRISPIVAFCLLVFSSIAKAEPTNETYKNKKGEVCRAVSATIYQPDISGPAENAITKIKMPDYCEPKSKKKRKGKRKGLDASNAECETFVQRIDAFVMTDNPFIGGQNFVVGETCTSGNFSQTKRPDETILAFDSAPKGMVVELYKTDEATPALSCTTPCFFEIPNASARALHARAIMPDGTVRNLPTARFGWSNTFFSGDRPYDTVLNHIPMEPADMTTAIPDPDAKPLVRVGPAWKDIAKPGDFCDVTFDVHPRGDTTNLRAERCSNLELLPSALESVRAWRFNPKYISGENIGRTSVKAKIEIR